MVPVLLLLLLWSGKTAEGAGLESRVMRLA
jgi:hypothetical protein